MIVIISIDFYSTKSNTLILKCFMQFTYTILDGWQNEGITFLICFRKRGYPERGVPSEKGGSNPGGNWLDYYHKKLNVKVASQVTKQLTVKGNKNLIKILSKFIKILLKAISIYSRKDKFIMTLLKTCSNKYFWLNPFWVFCLFLIGCIKFKRLRITQMHDITKFKKLNLL